MNADFQLKSDHLSSKREMQLQGNENSLNIRFKIPEYVLRRSSTSKITPASVPEYNDRAVWILWGCDSTDLVKKNKKLTSLFQEPVT